MSMTEWTCNNCGKTNSTQAKYCNCETCPNCGVYHGHDKSCKYYEQPCPSCKELKEQVDTNNSVIGQYLIDFATLKKENEELSKQNYEMSLCPEECSCKEELKQNWSECEEQRRVSWTKEKDAVEKYKELKQKLEGVMEELKIYVTEYPDCDYEEGMSQASGEAIDMINEVLK